ncbi:MAG: hypothetical protein DDT40_01091 [candidate division WS2 bacterium]|nr:hypothetical protein [Candidatus Psychracetigena formicireducens]MBT9150910.1 hypothetical protein [Candidatus Psychracetigena formicireducens]
MKKIPKDDRDKLWKTIEADIQDRGSKKDIKFVLKGKWKKFVRMQDGFKLFAVDGTWIRNNLSVIFGHGGHGYVHEFIPLDEIWISTHHYNENKWSRCKCNNVKENQKVSTAYFDSCTIHEITEFMEMRKGKSYWVAHQIALNKEREIGLLPDPDTEI